MLTDTRVTKTIDAYIKGCPKEARPILRKLKATIKAAAPDATEAIKYRMPTFVLHGNLVHFALMKNHIGFYPTPSPIIAFKKELAKYHTSKGAIQFPLNQPLPFNLVKKIVTYRVKQVSAKSK